jgi:uncharacterized protein (DUF697 family)
MTHYETLAGKELKQWQQEMQRRPGLLGKWSYRVQQRINSWIPEKVHQAITTAFRYMTQAVLAGSKFVTPAVLTTATLEDREARVRDRIKVYQTTATAEGALTGAAGFLVGLSDLPLWFAIKIKMLFDIAALYGYSTKDFKERVYLLYVMQLAFSSRQHRRKVYEIVANWEHTVALLPDDETAFDWRVFQQEYRDYLDIAKLMQLMPGIGAVAGAVVNHRLTKKLGITAMNAYRMRLNLSAGSR